MEFTYSLTWVDLMSMTEATGCGRGTYPPMVGVSKEGEVGTKESAPRQAELPEQLFYLKNHII
jgi:hypothetical protein